MLIHYSFYFLQQFFPRAFLVNNAGKHGAWLTSTHFKENHSFFFYYVTNFKDLRYLENDQERRNTKARERGKKKKKREVLIVRIF